MPLYLNETEVANFPLFEGGSTLNPTVAAMFQIRWALLSHRNLQFNDIIAAFGRLQFVPRGEMRGRWVW